MNVLWKLYWTKSNTCCRILTCSLALKTSNFCGAFSLMSPTMSKSRPCLSIGSIDQNLTTYNQAQISFSMTFLRKKRKSLSSCKFCVLGSASPTQISSWPNVSILTSWWSIKLKERLKIQRRGSEFYSLKIFWGWIPYGKFHSIIWIKRLGTYAKKCWSMYI